MTFGGKIWVVAEKGERKLEEASLELVSEGRIIADSFSGELCALVNPRGQHDANFNGLLAKYGADKVYLLNSPRLESHSPDLDIEALAALIREHEPDVVLLGSTPMGRDLAPRLAARLRSGLISDCVRVQADVANGRGRLVFTKIAYGGKIDTTVICLVRPQIVTIRPGIGKTRRPDSARKADLITLLPQIERTALTKVVGFLKADPKSLSLEDAEVIIAGGKGMGSAEGMHFLCELAEVLGGTVAGSRAAVDEGWLPDNKLVGISGKTVIPKLYLACGISGAAHHMMGMRDSETIVAINIDRQAPIFKIADVGIVGNALEIVPALSSKLKELTQNRSKELQQ